MHPFSLPARFILAGGLLVSTTAAIGLWGALTFARLSAAAAEALAASQEKIDLTAELAGSLEREDDALLLALSGDTERAARALAAERQRGDRCYRRLLAALGEGDREGRSAVTALRADMDRYRAAGSALLAAAARPDALARYHRQVNPLLRHAVTGAARIRERTFAALRQAGLAARDEAGQATGVVAGVSLLAVVLACAVFAWLARTVVRPVRGLTECVEAVRHGDFGRRAAPGAADELGALADGFNRMAETLAEYRSSSLGELLAAKTTLEATLNALPDAVIVIAPDGTLDTLNRPARAVLEAARAAAAERLEDLPLRPEHRRAVDAALAGQSAVPARADFGKALSVLLGGRSCRFLLRAVPVPEFAPRRCGAVIVLDDVTEFARLDELRGELIGVASHELKTPLTALRMNLLLLGEESRGLTDRQREMLEAAIGACDELGETIDELLDMTRIEAGQLRLAEAPVDLSAVLEQALRPLRHRFQDAGVRVEVLRDGGPAVARGDAARLRIVLTNLLTNALKYSPAGGTVTVRLSSGQNVGANGSPLVQIAVTDAGPGVPAEFRERVFEKFFRVEHHLGGGANGVHGTGIGLYLCREIVKAHGGAIRCGPGDSGAGTQVAFTLPADSPAS
jgi:NtrC-family two-component system sensor histidine kinase KinB